MRRYLMQTLAYSLQRRIRIRSGGLWTLLTLIGLFLIPNSLQAQCPDLIAPTVSGCPTNITVNVAPGTCANTAIWTPPNFNDAGTCGIVSVTNSHTPGVSSFPVGPATTVTYTATDGGGLSVSCSFTVTVVDNEDPVLSACPGNITINVDPGTCVGTTATWTAPTATDNCSATVSGSASSGDPFPIGTTTVTYTATDPAGLTDVCSFTVTVVDNEAPTAVCAPYTVVLNAAGVGTLTAADIDGGSADLCGAVTLSASQTTFGCADVGTQSVTLTVTDAAGNSSNCNATVTVQDNTPPTANCIAGTLTVNLDVNGNASITPAMINNASTDACGPLTFSVSPNAFTCADLGNNTVTLTVTDANSNSSTCTATVNVVNPASNLPTVVTQNISVDLDAAGNASITALQIDNGSSATCGVTGISVTPSTFTCTNVGTNTVTLTVTGQNGQTNTGTATVTVNDVTAPVITCPSAPAAVSAAAGLCEAPVTVALVTATDACGAPTITNNSAFATAGGADASGTYPVGTTTVTFTAADANGLTSTCTVDVTVNDVTIPDAICQNITVPLNGSGNATITAAMINNGSNDACGIQSVTASQTAFSCTDLGTNNVTLTVTDNNGLVNTCVAVVTVTDVVPPVFSCPANITVNVQPGQCNAQVTYAISATDNCTASPTIVRTVGLASGSAFPEGTTTVTHTATDAAGNVSTCTFNVTVLDNELPNAVCAPITVQLDGSGAGSITATDIDGGSTDNCGIASIAASQTAFACGDIGTLPVTLTVTDVNGNSSTCIATVTVADTIKPVAICQNVTVTLDASGNGSTTAAAVDNGSNDACGIASLSLSQTAFTCANVGANTVTLTVTDNNGNASTCTATVTVVDNIGPAITCVISNPIVDLDASGNATILPSLVDSISTDACGIASRTVSPNTFTCANVGTNTVTLTVTDVNGNSSTCTSNIVIRDTIAPVASCQDITVQLDGSGTASIVATDIDNGSNDACGIASLSISPSTFGCANVGANTVTLTVTDNNGNASTCTATVTVADTLAPTAVCQNVTVQLDGSGTASIVATDIDNGSSDACGIASLSVTPSSFTCANVGANTVTLTVTDVNGNSSTCTATVTVQDITPPVITCPATITVSNDAGSCDAVVSTLGLATATDICGIASITNNSLFATANGADANGTYPVGTTTVTFTATDNNGLTSTCTVDVIVQDTELPTITCNGDITVSNFPNLCTAPVSYFVLSADNCPGFTVSQTAGLASGAQFPVGTTTNTFVVTDAAGLTATCSFDVTVEDNQSPSIICPSDIIVNNDAGVCGAVINYTPPVGIDNCPLPVGATVLTTGFAPGATFPIGTTTVEYTVTDAVGQTAVCSFDVTVNDSENPTIACPADITMSNDVGVCGAVVTFATPTGADNCPGQTVVQTGGLASGATFPIGTTNVEFTVTDASGNTAVCDFDVTINDTENPTISCPADITVGNDAGLCTAVVTYNVTGADNCPSSNIVRTVGPASGSAFPLGTTLITHVITDASGNTATCSFNVIVNDTEAPTIACPANISVNNDAGLCSAVVTFTPPVGLDNCPGVSTALITPLASGSAFPVGVNTVTYRATDAAGNTTDCSFTITVTDNEDPVISACPSNIAQGSDVGDCGAVVTWTPPTVADNCGATLTSSHAPGDFFPVGTTTVTYNAVDGAGNNAVACTFDVVISDTEDPVATCPADITVNNDPGQCQASVTVPNPTVTDNCVGPYTIINDYNSTNDASDIYPVGTTTVTFTVTDVAGNTSSCSIDVTVIDNENPTILCPFPSQIALNGAGNIILSNLVFFNQAADNCPGPITFSFAPKDTFDCSDAGTTTLITITATDAAGNSNSCTTALTVVDNVAPVVSCPANITQSVDAGLCSAVVNYTGPTFTDNCPGSTINQTVGLASGSVFPIGTTTNTFEVTDAVGNVSICSFDVTVVDNENPTISCPADIIQSNDAGLCSAVITYNVPFADNCPGASIAQTAGLASGSAFPVGTTTNTFVVTDATGNSVNCSFDVTINDTEPPVITCPADITVQAATGVCDAVVTYTLPGVTENCDATPVPSLTAGLGSGATFPVGTTTETYSYTDPSGNTVTCSFTVTVEDNVAPTLTCPADIVQANDPGVCEAVVTWTPPVYSDNCAGVAISGFTYSGTFGGNHYYTSNTSMTWTAASAMAMANGGHLAVIETNAERIFVRANATGSQLWLGYTDEAVEGTFVPVTGLTDYYEYWAPGQPDNGGSGEDYVFMRPDGRWVDASATTTHPFVMEIGVSQLNSPAPGSTFPVGTTTISYQATDVNGNVSNCSFDVTVEDTEDPTIACPANISVNNDAGICGAVVSYAAITFADNCGATIAQTSGLASGSTFPVGTTTNTFVATDAAGNSATCSFDVVVTDNENPTITCPADITMSNDAGVCGATVTFATPAGADNCTGFTVAQTAGPSSGSVFPIGTTNVEFTVTDASGNTAVCAFDVTVNDTESPTIVCPSDITQSVDAGSCDAVVTYTPPVGLDNCAVTTVLTTAGFGSGATFPLGTTTVTYTATDASGNATSCSFTVTILDQDPPTITCPGDQTVSAPTGTCNAVVTYAAVTASDGCPGIGTISQTAGLASGSVFPLGTTTNTFEVTDNAGNTSTCSFDITVEDNENPVISCPPNITVNANGGQCTALVNYTGVSATDNCGPPTVNLIAGLGSGGSFPVGVNTETYQAIDASGNAVTCSFTITVIDNQVPTISCPTDIIVGNDAGICGATVSYPSPSFADNCPGAILSQTAGLASGSSFPLGTTTNTFVITDASGNTATCSFDVTVNDTEAPTLNCPGNITVTAGVGLCDAIVIYLGVTATDNCPGAPTISLIAGFNSGANFPVGVTTVTYEAVDATGNASTCSFTVTVLAAVPITQAVINNAIDPLSLSLEECEDIDINLSASAPDAGAGEAGTWTFIGTPPAAFTFTPNANDPNAVLSGVTASPPIYELEWAITDGCITTRDTIRIQINPTPTGIIVETVPISTFGASDGELLAIPLSGTPGYFFEWDNAPTNSTNPSAMNLATGNYSVVITDTKGCDDTLFYFLDQPLPQTVLVSPKVLLGGVVDIITGEMNDDLRGLVDFPLTEPYTAAGYPSINAGSSVATSAAVLAVTGSDAIVDWVLVELRDKTDRTTVLGRQPALIQADGDIVDAGDGVSPIEIIGLPDDYYVAIRHRNHLGVMSDAVVSLNAVTTTLADFTDGSLVAYQLPLIDPTSRAPLQVLTGPAFATTTYALWGGDANGDKVVTYAGATSDLPPISIKVLLDSGNPGFSTTYQVPGYNLEDLNMDGNVTYAGGTTDVTVITINVLLHPGNFGTFSLTFQIFEQIP